MRVQGGVRSRLDRPCGRDDSDLPPNPRARIRAPSGRSRAWPLRTGPQQKLERLDLFLGVERLVHGKRYFRRTGMATHDLHDATICGTRVDWAGRVAAFDFRTVHDGLVTLEAIGVTHVEMPHEDPWGPSVSVNEIRRTDTGMEIEMQSGDVLVVSASGLRFT